MKSRSPCELCISQRENKKWVAKRKNLAQGFEPATSGINHWVETTKPLMSCNEYAMNIFNYIFFTKTLVGGKRKKKGRKQKEVNHGLDRTQFLNAENESHR